MSPHGAVRSVDATRFAMVPRNDVPRSAFDVSHGHKTTFDAGFMVPIYVDEVLPGDSLRMKMTAFCRLSTPIVPMMDNLEFESFFFFCPNRLLWSNWERFMGEQTSPSDTTTFLTPYVEFTTTAALVPGTVGDYMGVHYIPGSPGTLRVSALPFRAFNLIWNEWFRDQDIQTKRPENIGDGPDAYTDYLMVRRGKRHDYFTSARPWPQKPYNIDQLPASSTYNNNLLNSGFMSYSKGAFSQEGIGAPIVGLGYSPGTTPSGSTTINQPGGRVGVYGNHYTEATFRVRTGGAAAGTSPDIRVLVNDIRTAVMVQSMLERNARGGTRYTEIIRSHFGVLSPDARLQRPEYLGGGRAMINITPVAQTSASGITGSSTVMGEQAAVGTSVITNHGFSSSFTEHGIIIGMVNIRSYLTYQQGNHRMWNRRTQFDFYWPGLAHLGEQAILSQEIYADASTNDVSVFGFQERWAEYKWKPSRTSGYFRSGATTPLDMWHLGVFYGSRPVLNAAFVEEAPPISRVLQVDTNFGAQFLFDSLFEARWVRPMPIYSIPGFGPRL